MKLRINLLVVGLLFFAAALAQPVNAQTPSTASSEKKDTPPASAEARPTAPTPPHVTILKDAKTISGLWTVYQKGNSLYWEIGSSDLMAEYILVISISRGNFGGHTMLLGGMPLNGFGDDWVWQFRKVGENIHVIRKNVRFKATPNSPEARAVAAAYTDSVLFSLPIMTKGPKGGDLVDLTSVFMSDLPQVGMALPGFTFSSQKSSWSAVKGFDENMELDVAATFASSGQRSIDTIPDTRGATINIHYSLSKIPSTGYQPRLADDRVGYFLTVVKDYSSKNNREQFVRYINRWDLQKADPSADPSPPKRPIVFHIEKTVPFKYRKAVYDGIYEWNKAFEKAGFVNAIEVHQQLDNDDKDPEDIRYNFFRWITTSRPFAFGPSRANPYTGQILDADILFDADFLTHWKEEYENLSVASGPKSAGLFGGSGPQALAAPAPVRTLGIERCLMGYGMPAQLAFGTAAIDAYAADPKVSAENLEKLFQQAIKETTMHEVGHTLGLRHNFKGSKWRSLSDLNDTAKAQGCLSASVMDYNPTNIVPKDWKQGDFYCTTLGPYDDWAIEYGYKAISGDSAAELKKIASRSGEPALQYATDEDTGVFSLTGLNPDPDPDSNQWDLGQDPLAYAKQRLQIVQEVMPGLIDRVTKEGDNYTQARRTFQILLNQYSDSMYFVSRNVGGLKTSRSHKGDKDGPPPISLVNVKLQREALSMLEDNVFSDKPFQFPPELYNHLGWANWMHWGTDLPRRKDFGIHDFVLVAQERILAQLLSGVTLKRMHDTELRAASDVDVMTTAELIQRLTKAIFSEVETTKEGDYTNRKPAISSLRRNLQRSYLDDLSKLALGSTMAPEDCQTIAYSELTNLQQRIKSLLDNQPISSKLDAYSRAHLQESAARIAKVLDARLMVLAPR
jgi:Met-zincin/Domain of unknown function (DUF5117)/Domain of unknown function (DUF5118)